MRFEERDSKPYAEPVAADRLQVGSVYFFLTFADEAMLAPELEPVVFIGRDLGAHDVGRIYFQDFASYEDGLRWSAAENSAAVFHCGSDQELGHVFEFERALDVLLACSLRRRGQR
jgi:hypothetical protein